MDKVVPKSAEGRADRNVLRLLPGMRGRLDAVARDATRALGCPISRSALMRAAVLLLLLRLEAGNAPRDLLRQIHGAVLVRGRRRRG